MTAGHARAAVVGLGHSPVYRRDDVPLGALTIEACRAAIADAGLDVADIDGIASNPDQPFPGAGQTDGIHVVTPEFVARSLRLENLRWAEHAPGKTMISEPFLKAVYAIAAGACDTVLVFRGMHNPSGRYGHADASAAAGLAQYRSPYGLTAPAWAGMLWQEYMTRYGTSREEMADVALNARRYALMWEHGYWYQHKAVPLTREEYENDRMVSWPIGLHDCDLPVQGAAAFVITSAERAPHLVDRAAYIVGTAQTLPHDRTMFEPLAAHEDSCRRLARDLWRSSGIDRADVDVVNVYDGFTIFVPMWLEALGFSDPGAGLSQVSLAANAPAGRFPLNTSSGSQGAGRMHGIPQLMDGALQVMGRSGPRQVPDAEVSLVVCGAPQVAGGIVYSSRPAL